jgi:hypothetical protein
VTYDEVVNAPDGTWYTVRLSVWSNGYWREEETGPVQDDCTAQELAEWVAGNQNIFDEDQEILVEVWLGRDADTETLPDAEYTHNPEEDA